MIGVFVDTGAFFGLLVAEDGHHAAAESLFRRVARERWRLVTMNAVVFEMHALLLKRLGGSIHVERLTGEPAFDPIRDRRWSSVGARRYRRDHDRESGGGDRR